MEKRIMNSSIRNELHYREIVIQSEESYEEDYQVRMIRENSLPHILKMQVSGKDRGCLYSYDISGMRNLKKLCENQPCKKVFVEELLQQFLEVILAMNNYMLDMNYILLDPEYIFWKDEVFYFCYYPVSTRELREGFHELAEFLVKSIDYGDYSGVILVCNLHKATMDEQYDLTTLIGEHTTYYEQEIEDYNQEREKIQREEHLWQEEWIEDGEENILQMQQQSGSENTQNSTMPFWKMKNVLRESSVGKYWAQKKKDRWGNWDDLLTQEESSIMEQS